MASKILRLPAVQEATGLSRSSIYLKITRGDFPAQVCLGDRAVGWREQDIQKWIDERIQKSFQ